MGKNAINVHAIVYGVRTLVDHGIRVTFDLPETAIAQAAMLMECKRQGIPLEIDIKSDDENLTKLDDETKKRPEKPVTRVGRRRS